MKLASTRLDKLILFCRNLQQSTALYSQALGLKVFLQSQTFVQLKDSNNFSLYLQSSKQPSQLIKGYSPMLSFKVEDFQKTVERLEKYDLLMDGEVKKSEFGSVATFIGMDHEFISINDFEVMQEELKVEQMVVPKDQDKETAEIKRLLAKIKI